MALSIGIDHVGDNWKTALTENGHTLELCTFMDVYAVATYVEQTCALYPEPSIALSSPLATVFSTPPPFTDSELPRRVELEQAKDLNALLADIHPMSFRSYNLPAIAALPSIPRHRKLNRSNMGSAAKLCSVAMLLYRMRQQEATWAEMHFLYLDLDQQSRSMIIVESGCIVDGFSTTNTYMSEADQELNELAFWEGLTQELAGLMAIHHFEDIVVIDRYAPEGKTRRKDAVVDQFSDAYQFYLFPHREAEPEGFEAAIGAAIIAEGLNHPGLAAEVVAHLQISGQS